MSFCVGCLILLCWYCLLLLDQDLLLLLELLLSYEVTIWWIWLAVIGMAELVFLLFLAHCEICEL